MKAFKDIQALRSSKLPKFRREDLAMEIATFMGETNHGKWLGLTKGIPEQLLRKWMAEGRAEMSKPRGYFYNRIKEWKAKQPVQQKLF